jgi:hypothetical protein
MIQKSPKLRHPSGREVRQCRFRELAGSEPQRRDPHERGSSSSPDLNPFGRPDKTKIRAK